MTNVQYSQNFTILESKLPLCLKYVPPIRLWHSFFVKKRYCIDNRWCCKTRTPHDLMVFRVWSRVLIFAMLSSSECPLSGPETATWRRLTWGQQVSSVPGGGMKPLEEEEEGCGDRGGEDDGNMNTHWTQLGETWIEDRSKGRISMWQFCLDISTCRYSYCQIIRIYSLFMKYLNCWFHLKC